MESKNRIIIGIIFVFLTAWLVEAASINHHVRFVRDAEKSSTDINNFTTTTTANKLNTSESLIISSPRTDEHLDLHSKSSSLIENKIKKIGDSTSAENEHSKITTQSTDSFDSSDKIKSQRGTVKYQQPETKTTEPIGKKEVDEDDSSTKKQAQEEQTSPATENKNGRSLSIDIEKYVSPEFHNKNNVYSLPTSPEIEKYIDHDDSREFIDHVTVSDSPKTTLTEKPSSPMSFSNFDLTTPESKIFDKKYQLAVDRITQNLDDREIQANTESFKSNEQNNFHDDDDDDDDENKYDVSKLINNYNNADNDTEINLHANEFKNIDINVDSNKHDKDMESGKNVDYESKFLKSHSYDEKPDQTENKTESDKKEQEVESTMAKPIDPKESQTKSVLVPAPTTTKPGSGTTVLPGKRVKSEISLRNNTIETTASDSDLKSKSLKHFSGETTNINPLHETERVSYTKPPYENAINITKRGSSKTTVTSDRPVATTASFMDYDNKNFSIPPTATAWTLVSLKDVPHLSTSEQSATDNKTDIEQNSQENQLVRVQLSTPDKKESQTTTEKSPNTLSANKNTIIKISDTTVTNTEHTSLSNSNKIFKSTDPLSTTETDSDETETTSVKLDITTEQINSDDEDSNTDVTTSNLKTTTNSDDTSTVISTTMEPILTTDNVATESSISYDHGETETTTEKEDTSTSSFNSKESAVRTETENDLFTTTQNEDIIVGPTIVPTVIPKVQKTSVIPHLEDEELDNSGGDDTDYLEFTIKKDKSDVPTNASKTEVKIPMENDDQEKNSVSTKTVHSTTTPTSVVSHGPKSINNYAENSTIDATSSTESLSHDDNTEEKNPGMIAAIAISTIGGVCLILLTGLLFIMKKRQKRVTYGQRCRPVSLDAYSLDNVSVYNSVRRKGVMRASKRSYGNPAFDDPVSISHQMNFQQLAKFVDNVEAIHAEFEEIPQVTARASEVPDGCETKNRYANVIPLPETRVLLKTFDNDLNSDYINANYVTGPKNIRGYYIATQGPMNSTVDDFWRMIWEQQSRVILMLTNLYENGIDKCADYLPPSEVLDCHRLFGDFQITLKKREVKEKYIISSLQLKNMVSNSWREVTHLWYIGWPDRGVPAEANSLIAFLIEARSHLKAASNNNTSSDDKTNETMNIHISGVNGSASESGPMVVHCSPGTGRTGTVIACDIAIRDFELTRNVDIPKIVYRVRRDRASAVQTKEQYGFIYKLITLYATKLTGGALDSI